MLKGLQERLPGGGIVAELPLQQPDNFGGIRGQYFIFEVRQQLFISSQRFLLFPRIEQRLGMDAPGKQMIRRAFYDTFGNSQRLFGRLVFCIVLGAEIQPRLDIVVIGHGHQIERHGNLYGNGGTHNRRSPSARLEIVEDFAAGQDGEGSDGRKNGRPEMGGYPKERERRVPHQD
ncbi:MAG: hypothetical protein BWX80_01606 [Candidatus Hydrogenedentes bacterium ADurb.Bin101]|nr:MAG: hypothetical protein BWX80_01606 [Candidatus Hydrogenedentes bacterium ADurb.Bin101]